ncbi:MAG: HNH endonuclease family protein [Beutenbergiaceae bacterium]
MAAAHRTAAGTVLTWAIVVLLTVSVGSLIPRWWAQVRPVAPTAVDSQQIQAAQAALPRLRVTQPLPLANYQREFFGDPWADTDSNGCDTRNDVLAAWLSELRIDVTQPCLVVSGHLRDPYTGDLLMFRRGPSTSAEIQIDHVVALADAWRKGAANWTAEQALRFANDRANLIPTSAAANSDKGADDAAHWLPPNSGYHCAYAVQQIMVKLSYGIGVTSEEVSALRGALQSCRPPDAGADGTLLPTMSEGAANLTAHPVGHRQHPRTTPARGRTRRRHVRTGGNRRLFRLRPQGGHAVRVRPAASARRSPWPHEFSAGH